MKNKFIDTHCHLYGEYYDDIASVLALSEELGVGTVVNNAANITSCKEILSISKDYPNMYVALGIHPEDVDSYSDDDIQFIASHINDEKVVAVGEIGLDYHYTKENREKQIDLFRKQLMIAQTVNKPVIIHSRDATQDVLDILSEYDVRGIMHAFNGSLEVANILIKRGFLLGIGGVITFKNCNLKDVVKNIDLKHIVLETDAPYLAPVPYRGKRNIPGYLMETAKFISELKGVSLEELVNITNENYYRIFDK